MSKDGNVKAEVVRRDDQFVEKSSTKIWNEHPSKNNPYIAESVSCHGFDLITLLQKRSFVDVVYLLFRGELPGKNEAELFEKLMIAFINPGPRHPATRAAMNAGVGNTESAHILPIGLTVLGGNHLGAAEVEKSMRWLRRNSRRDATSVAKELLNSNQTETEDGHVAPGFGSHFESIDELVGKLAKEFSSLNGAGKIFAWSNVFVGELNKSDYGWLSTGLVAAILCDLGFQPRMGPGIFQMISAPGIFAHGIEMANKPITAMPFLDDSDYYIESEFDRNEKELEVIE